MALLEDEKNQSLRLAASSAPKLPSNWWNEAETADKSAPSTKFMDAADFDAQMAAQDRQAQKEAAAAVEVERSFPGEVGASLVRGGLGIVKLVPQVGKIVGSDILGPVVKGITGRDLAKEAFTPMIEGLEDIAESPEWKPSKEAGGAPIDLERIVSNPGEVIGQITSQIANPRFWASQLPEGAMSMIPTIVGSWAPRAVATAGKLGKALEAAKVAEIAGEVGAAAKVAEISSKIQRLGTIGMYGASMAMEAGQGEEKVREYEEKTGEKISWGSRVTSILGTGVVAGGLEALSLGRVLPSALLGRKGKSPLAVIENILNGKGGREIVNKVLAMVATEGLTEGAQSIVENAFPRGFFDKNQKLLEGVVESMLIGAALGGLGGGAESISTHREAGAFAREGGEFSKEFQDTAARIQDTIKKAQDEYYSQYKPILPEKPPESILAPAVERPGPQPAAALTPEEQQQAIFGGELGRIAGEQPTLAAAVDNLAPLVGGTERAERFYDLYQQGDAATALQEFPEHSAFATEQQKEVAITPAERAQGLPSAFTGRPRQATHPVMGVTGGMAQERAQETSAGVTSAESFDRTGSDKTPPAPMGVTGGMAQTLATRRGEESGAAIAEEVLAPIRDQAALRDQVLDRTGGIIPQVRLRRMAMQEIEGRLARGEEVESEVLARFPELAEKKYEAAAPVVPEVEAAAPVIPQEGLEVEDWAEGAVDETEIAAQERVDALPEGEVPVLEETVQEDQSTPAPTLTPTKIVQQAASQKVGPESQAPTESPATKSLPSLDASPGEWFDARSQITAAIDSSDHPDRVTALQVISGRYPSTWDRGTDVYRNKLTTVLRDLGYDIDPLYDNEIIDALVQATPAPTGPASAPQTNMEVLRDLAPGAWQVFSQSFTDEEVSLLEKAIDAGVVKVKQLKGVTAYGQSGDLRGWLAEQGKVGSSPKTTIAKKAGLASGKKAGPVAKAKPVAKHPGLPKGIGGRGKPAPAPAPESESDWAKVARAGTVWDKSPANDRKAWIKQSGFLRESVSNLQWRHLTQDAQKALSNIIPQQQPAAPAPAFKEGDRVSWTERGKPLTGTLRGAPDRFGNVDINVDQVVKAGGVPVGRVSMDVKIENLTKLEEEANAPEAEPKAPEVPVKAHTKLAGKIKDWLDSAPSAKMDSKTLYSMADKVYGGTMAQGTYTPKDAYDAMELGVNLHIQSKPELYNPHSADPAKVIFKLRQLQSMLPTQTRRTGEMDEFQQFSTPPALAYMVNWVANIGQNDVALEPSGGIGGIAVFASNAGAKEVIVNELSPRRAELLREMGFDQIFTENAEQLNNVLPKTVKPTVVVMNPPFSATAGRMMGRRDTMIGAKHIEQALKRLEPGGRLVAIVGRGMAFGKPTFSEWWGKIKKEYNVLANVGISGKNYTKYGTSFDNQILVIDKTGATSPTETVAGAVERIEDLIPLLEGVKDARQQLANQPGSQKGATPTETQAGSKGTVPRPASELVEEEGGTPDSGVTDSGNVGNVRPADGSTTPGNNAGVRGKPSGQGGTVGPAGTVQSGETDVSPESGAGGVGATGKLDVGKQPVRGQSDAGASGVVDVEATENEESKSELTDSIYEAYTPQRLKIPGAKPHPAKLVESAAMSSVKPPVPTYKPQIPQKVISEGHLSDSQIEAVVYAGQAHSQMLESGERRGFAIGDGTGVGKGREISGIFLDNWEQGRKKGVWLSQNGSLLDSAQRDVKGVGWDPRIIKPLPGNYNPLSGNEGILFLGYDTLKSRQSTKDDKQAVPKTRMDQVVEWLGEDFDGVIAFDEAHNMNNAKQSQNAGFRGKKASQKALAGVELQRRLPNARVVYVSATMGEEVEHFAFADRLGLWGPGTEFANKNDFLSKVTSGGVASMEVVARDMKALGSYMARSLSFDGVKYERLTHDLNPDQTATYDALAKVWQVVFANVEKALEDTGADQDTASKRAALGQFWGYNQRFFNQVTTALAMPSVLKNLEEDLAKGYSPVLQLVNTYGDAQDKAIKNRGEDVELDELDMTPRQMLAQYLERSFPTVQHETYTDDNGDEQVRVVLDSDGNPVHNQEAVAARDKMLTELGMTKFPDNPIDQIINKFGPGVVAEITGRKQRLIKVKGETRLEKRGDAAVRNDIKAYNDGTKRILIFSQKGDTGASYHADLSVKNQALRRHYLLQAGWQAKRALQGFGRTHRTNQAQAPEYILVETNIKGHKRFISSIARRLDQLGALTKGQRQTGSSGLLKASDNLETVHAEIALERLVDDLIAGQLEDISADEFMEQTGWKLTYTSGGSVTINYPTVKQFMNRMLAMQVNYQDIIYEAFDQRHQDVITRAADAGTLDLGMETIFPEKGGRIEKVSEELVYTEPNSGAETKVVAFDITNPTKPRTFDQADETNTYFIQNKSSGYVWAFDGRAVSKTKDDGTITKEFVGLGQRQGARQWVEERVLLDDRKWTRLRKGEARPLWDAAVAKLPKESTDRLHMITGTLLPIWSRLSGSTRVKRLQTQDGTKYLGRVIDSVDLDSTLKALGATPEARQLEVKNGGDIYEKVLDNNYVVTLANGWKFRRALVSGEQRIELIGSRPEDLPELQRAGLIVERISYETRTFIPVRPGAFGTVDPTRSVEAIDVLIKRRPVIEAVPRYTSGAARYSLAGRAGLGAGPAPGEGPTITLQAVQERFGGVKVHELEGGKGFHLTLPNGKLLMIMTGQDLTARRDEVLKTYGREMKAGEWVAGEWRQMSVGGVVALAKAAGIRTLDHETFHAACDLVLTKGEWEAVLRKYGDWEAAARAYESWKPAESHKFFQKILNFFRRLAQLIGPTAHGTFAKIKSGEVWVRTAAGPGTGATGAYFLRNEFREKAREALENPGYPGRPGYAYPKETIEKLLDHLDEGLQRLPASWYEKLVGPENKTRGGYYRHMGKPDAMGEIGLGFDDMIKRYARTRNPESGQFLLGHEIGHGVLDDLAFKLGMTPDQVVKEFLPQYFKEGSLRELNKEFTKMTGTKVDILQEHSELAQARTRPFGGLNRFQYWEMNPSELGADFIGLHAAGILPDNEIFKALKDLSVSSKPSKYRIVSQDAQATLDDYHSTLMAQDPASKSLWRRFWDKDPALKASWTEMYQGAYDQVVDRFAPGERAQDKLAKAGIALPAGEQFTSTIGFWRGQEGWNHEAVLGSGIYADKVETLGTGESFFTGATPTRVGDSLFKRVDPIRALAKTQSLQNKEVFRDLRLLMVAQRDLELAGETGTRAPGEIKGVRPDESRAALQALETKYGNDFSQLQEVANGIREWADQAILQRLVQGGIITQDLYDKIKVKNQAYVPFARLMDELDQYIKSTGGGKVIKEIKGSERAIVDPFQMLIELSAKANYAYAKNRMIRSLYQMGQASPEMGITELKPKIIPSGMVRKDKWEPLGKSGWAMERELPLLKKGYAFSQLPPEPGAIPFYRDGKRSWLKLPPDLHGMMQNLLPEDLGLLMRVLKWPADVLRTGAVTTPEFGLIKNPLRDLVQAWLFNRAGFSPLKWWRDLYLTLSKDPAAMQMRSEMAAGGGFMATLAQSMVDEKITAEDIEGKKKNIAYVAHPVEALRTLSAYLENLTRFSLYKQARENGFSHAEAVHEARRTTLDFRRLGGHPVARYLNMIIPFWNANIQGTDKLITELRGPNKAAVMRRLGALTAASIGLALLFHDDDRLKELEDWEKNYFWHIPLGKTGPIIRLPKPFEAGIMFGSIPERLVEVAMGDNTTGLQAAVKAAVDALTPEIIPAILRPLVELKSNYNFFLGRPIEDAGLQNLPVELRSKPWTTPLAKAISAHGGNLIGLSPVKIEHFVRSFSGGLGANYYFPGADLLLRKAGVLEDLPNPQQDAIERAFGIRALFTKPPVGYRAKSVGDFFENVQGATQADQGWKLLWGTDKVDTFLKDNPEAMFASLARKQMIELGKIKKERNAIHTSKALTSEQKKAKLDALDEKIVTLARAGNALMDPAVAEAVKMPARKGMDFNAYKKMTSEFVGDAYDIIQKNLPKIIHMEEAQRQRYLIKVIRQAREEYKPVLSKPKDETKLESPYDKATRAEKARWQSVMGFRKAKPGEATGYRLKEEQL